MGDPNSRMMEDSLLRYVQLDLTQASTVLQSLANKQSPPIVGRGPDFIPSLWFYWATTAGLDQQLSAIFGQVQGPISQANAALRGLLPHATGGQWDQSRAENAAAVINGQLIPALTGAVNQLSPTPPPLPDLQTQVLALQNGFHELQEQLASLAKEVSDLKGKSTSSAA